MPDGKIEPKPLPCPFCGGANMEFHGLRKDEIYIECLKCRMRSINCLDREHALEKWNKRIS